MIANAKVQNLLASGGGLAVLGVELRAEDNSDGSLWRKWIYMPFPPVVGMDIAQYDESGEVLIWAMRPKWIEFHAGSADKSWHEVAGMLLTGTYHAKGNFIGNFGFDRTRDGWELLGKPSGS